MKTYRIAGHRVEVYDSIDELTVSRFHKYNKFMLIDSGVGSDLEDINTHLRRLKHLVHKDTDKAQTEIDNMRQNMHFIMQELTPRHLAFAALVKSIDGSEILDLSDSNLEKVNKILNKAPLSFLEKIIREVKKKLESEIELYFPGSSDSVLLKQYYDVLKRKTVLQLKCLIDKKDRTKEIKALSDELLLFADPKKFHGPESLEILIDNAYQESCIFTDHTLGTDSKNMTVLRYYNSLAYIKKIKSDGRQSAQLRGAPKK